MTEIPMTKSQIPMKSQNPMTNARVFPLGFGYWDLICPAEILQNPQTPVSEVLRRPGFALRISGSSEYLRDRRLRRISTAHPDFSRVDFIAIWDLVIGICPKL